MAQPLPKDSPLRPAQSRSYKRRVTNLGVNAQTLDAATVASKLQLDEENRELIYSCIAFAMKLGFMSIGLASLFNLGMASQQRIQRHLELSSLVKSETQKFEKLHQRFDYLFTIGGESRFMEEQDQLIMPNSLRVIWR